METPTKCRKARVEITTPIREQFLQDALLETKGDGKLP